MSRVFSQKFLELPSLTGGPSTAYTVPPGFLAVVKCITITWGIVTLSGVDAWVQTETLAKLARYTWFTSLGDATNNGGTQLFWGAWTLEEGQSLQGQAGTGTVDIWASGYLLDLP